MATIGIIAKVGGGFSFPSLNGPKPATKHHPVCSSSCVSVLSSSRGNICPSGSTGCRRLLTRRIKVVMASLTETEKLGIKIVKNPPESKLSELGVRSWPKWGCPPSNFPWTYSSKETCYLLKGKVKVYPEGSNEAVEIGAGDLVVFPKGMSCTWDVSEAVDKHYKFD